MFGAEHVTLAVMLQPIFLMAQITIYIPYQLKVDEANTIYTHNFKYSSAKHINVHMYS